MLVCMRLSHLFLDFLKKKMNNAVLDTKPYASESVKMPPLSATLSLYIKELEEEDFIKMGKPKKETYIIS